MEFVGGDCQHSIALCHASKAGQLQLVRQLLGKGAWKEVPWSRALDRLTVVIYISGLMPGFDGVTFSKLVGKGHPLIAAADNGHTDVCKLLLEKCVHPDVVHQALCRAAAGGHILVVQSMVQELQQRYTAGVGPYPGTFLSSEIASHPWQGPDLYDHHFPYPTCVVAAAAGGSSAILQLLLDQGALPWVLYRFTLLSN
jgi:hypothetical protein